MIAFWLVVPIFSVLLPNVQAEPTPNPQVTASVSQIETMTDSVFSVDFELRNIGDPSSTDSFLSVSVSAGLEINSYSTTPYLPDVQFTHYYPGDLISHSDGTQKMAFYELVDVHGHPYSAGELVAITLTFRAPPWTSAHWIKYRAAMLPEGVIYPTDVPTQRDPSEGDVEDQQGYPVYIVDVQVAAPEGEWFAEVKYDPFDSDGDGQDDAVRIGMNADAVDGTMTVHVYNSMNRNFGAHGFVDDDSQQWEITGTNVEWEYSFLYVSLSHPYGNYKVTLHLYDESNNLEDEYIFYLDLYPGEANPREWIKDVRITYVQYDETGPLPIEWPNVVKIEIDADTEGGEVKLEADGELRDDEGNVLDYSGTGGWTIHGTEDEWSFPLYLWLDPPNPPGYYSVILELYNWDAPCNLEDTMEITVGQLYPTGYTPPEFELTVSAEIASPPVLGETVSLEVTLENTGTSPLSAGEYTVTVSFWDYYDKGGVDSTLVWYQENRYGITSHMLYSHDPTDYLVPVLNPGETHVLPVVEVPVPIYQEGGIPGLSEPMSPSLVFTDTIEVKIDGPDASNTFEVQDIFVQMGLRTCYDAVAAVIAAFSKTTAVSAALTAGNIILDALEATEEQRSLMIEAWNNGDRLSAVKYCALMCIEMLVWYNNMPLENQLSLAINFLIPWEGGVAIVNMLIWYYNFKAIIQENGLDLSSVSPLNALAIAVGLIIDTDPVNLTIVDPNGRRVGVTSEPGLGTLIVNESPNAYFVEVNGTVEAVFFPELIEGTYYVNCTGVTQGDFNLRVQACYESELICNETFTGFIDVGDVLTSEVVVAAVGETFEVTPTEPRPLPIGIADVAIPLLQYGSVMPITFLVSSPTEYADVTVHISIEFEAALVWEKNVTFDFLAGDTSLTINYTLIDDYTYEEGWDTLDLWPSSPYKDGGNITVTVQLISSEGSVLAEVTGESTLLPCTRECLWDRIVEIILKWPTASPEQRESMWDDIVKIILLWPIV